MYRAVSACAAPRGSHMQFRLLGSVEVSTQDGPQAIGGPRSRAVMVALLLRANLAVPVSNLASAVWESAPASAESTCEATWPGYDAPWTTVPGW
jgi:hypothetical protein